jgi:hypothetical protein
MLASFLDLSWRTYPAAVIAAVGVVALGASIRVQKAARSDAMSPERVPLALVSTIRLLLVGASLLAFGAGLLFERTWIMVLAAVIGAEELLETSIAASALKKGIRTQKSGHLSAAKRT